jgi:uncharacterized membrane protein
MSSENDIDPIDEIMVKSIILSIAIGVAATVFLIWDTTQEYYSALYIYPDSYSNYVNPGDTVTFRYGVKSYEKGEMEYTLQIYLGNELIKTKKFTLKSGETWEENESIVLPENMKFPTKVMLVLNANGKTYEVHFWLREMPKG